jgi:S1-C subfamily serine protease
MTETMIRTLSRVVVGVLALTVSAARGLLPQAKAAADGWIGVAVSSDPGPIRVAEVFPGSPADFAGLRIGDTLLAIRNVPASRVALREILGRLSPGDIVNMLVGQQRRRVLKMTAIVRPALDAGGISVIVIQLDSVRRHTRTYLDLARGHMTVVAGPGVQLEQSDTSLVVSNEKRGIRFRLDSVLARSERMREGETRSDSAAGANVQVLRATTAVVWEMAITSVPPAALQSMAGAAAATGLLVVRVEAGGRAARMGIQALDVISQVDGYEVATVDQVRTALEARSTTRHRITVRRGGRQLKLNP